MAYPPPMEIPTLTTSRLVLRPFRMDDAKTLHSILNQDGILRYFPNPQPPALERVEKFIASQLKHWEEHGFGWWAVEPRDQNKLLGWNGLQYLPETEEVEVGFLLDEAWWGNGLATEGAQASLEDGFMRLGLKRIVAIVHPQNIASQRVIEKLGMSFVDHTEYFGMEVYRYRIEASTHETIC